MSPTSAVRPVKRRILVGAMLASTAMLAQVGCTSDDQPPAHPGSPTDALLREAESAGSSCVIVIQDDQVIVSRQLDSTDDGEPVRAWSVTKSVTSLLVGIAADRNLLDLDDPVAEYVPEWEGTASAQVTVRDILSNTSGRHWDQRSDYIEMALRARDKTAYATALGQDVAPAQRWVYNNSAVQVLEAVLESATAQPVTEFAEQNLFAPAGMNDTLIGVDAVGNANLFAGMRTTCTDLGRLGQLVLQHGSIDGKQLISAEYLAEATSEPSTSLNASYGLLWWLNHPGPAVMPDAATGGEVIRTNGPVVPAAPTDTIWAVGFNQQILVVIPSRNAVAIRLGRKPPAGSTFGVRSFTEAVLRVLE